MTDALRIVEARVNARCSWGLGFRRAVRLKRFAFSHTYPHVCYSWLEAGPALDRQALMDAVSLQIDEHAAWLNGEAISYREAIGHRKVNGWFIE